MIQLRYYRREGESALLFLTGWSGLLWGGVGLLGALAATHPTAAGALVGDNQFFVGNPPMRVLSCLHASAHLVRLARLRREGSAAAQQPGSPMVLVSCFVLVAWIVLTALVEARAAWAR